MDTSENVMLFRIASVVLSILAAAGYVLGQTIISGTVKDLSDRAVQDAHVVVSGQSEGIIGFAFTDSLGAFSLEISRISDSLTLKVSHLAYLPYSAPIKSYEEYVEITLQPGELELPQITVKVDPVTRHGDTLIFDINSYSREDDRTLEDVLSRLPGIYIEPSGKILYRGLPISKFYIEGLDMLEGRYKIATQNLGLNNIRDIEIIERHQFKKVLRDIEPSQNAAINIKLKSKVAFTGSLSAGVATGDPDYSVRGDLFGFTKSYQFVGLASSNTFGLSERASFADIQYTYTSYDHPILSLNELQTPWYLAPQNYLENNEQLVGGLGLLKLGSDDVLKMYSTYTRDNYSLSGSENVLFKLPGLATLSQDYQYSNSYKPDNWSSHIIYEKNGDRMYIRSKNTLGVSDNHEIGKNIYNSNPVTEGLANNHVEAKSSNEIIFKLPQRALTIYVDISYKSLEESLKVDTIDLRVDDAIKGFIDLEQAVDRSLLQGHIWTRLLRKFNQSTFGVQAGLRALADNMSSFLKAEMPINTLGSSFQNDQTLRQYSPYLDLSYSLISNKRQVTFGIPMRWLIYRIEDKIRLTQTMANPFLYSINANYLEKINEQYNWSLDYTYRNDVESLFRPVHAGFILYSNRTIDRGVLDFNRLNEHSIGATASYLNSYTNRMNSLGLSYTTGSYQFLNVVQFDLIGSNNAQIEQSNEYKRFNIDANSNGKISHGLDYVLKYRYSWFNRMLESNGQLLSISNQTNTLDFSLSCLIGKSILTVHPDWIWLRNNTTRQNASRSTYKLVYYSRFSDWGTLRLDGGAYVNSADGVSRWNSLYNFNCEFEWKKSRTKVLFEVNNLSQVGEFITLEQYLNQQQIFSLRVRPVQLRLRIKKSW